MRLFLKLSISLLFFNFRRFTYEFRVSVCSRLAARVGGVKETLFFYVFFVPLILSFTFLYFIFIISLFSLLLFFSYRLYVLFLPYFLATTLYFSCPLPFLIFHYYYMLLSPSFLILFTSLFSFLSVIKYYFHSFISTLFLLREMHLFLSFLLFSFYFISPMLNSPLFWLVIPLISLFHFTVVVVMAQIIPLTPSPDHPSSSTVRRARMNPSWRSQTSFPRTPRVTTRCGRHNHKVGVSLWHVCIFPISLLVCGLLGKTLGCSSETNHWTYRNYSRCDSHPDDANLT